MPLKAWAGRRSFTGRCVIDLLQKPNLKLCYGIFHGMRAYTRVEDRGVERRTFPRRRTLLSARLAFGDPSIIMSCGVRNLSDNGAQIELESAAFIQPPFRLLMMRDGVIHEADLIWSWGKMLGLSFNATHRAEAPVAEDLKILRVLWSATRA